MLYPSVRFKLYTYKLNTRVSVLLYLLSSQYMYLNHDEEKQQHINRWSQNCWCVSSISLYVLCVLFSLVYFWMLLALFSFHCKRRYTMNARKRNRDAKRVSATKTNLNLNTWEISEKVYSNISKWNEVTHRIRHNNNLTLGKSVFFIAQETVKIKVWTNKQNRSI